MENEENQKQVSHRFPQPLEIANDAIPTFPQPRRGAEKWKTKPRFPTFPLVVLFFSERRPGDRFAPLQAHSSIRICSVGQTVGFCRLPGDPVFGSPAKAQYWEILLAGRQ